MKTYILTVIVALTFFSCNDRVKMKEEDLQKYPWLTSFLIGEISNFNGTHNIDIGTMQFSYETTIKTKDGILAKFDSAATDENWSLVSSSIILREYSKKLNQYPADTEKMTLKIELDTIENRIRFDTE